MKTTLPRVLTGACLLAGVALGCTRDTSNLKPAPPNDDPVVFDDDFGEAVDYQAFLGSNFQVLDIDSEERHNGTASLRVTVPAPGNGYAGGAFTTTQARYLAGYNALTFWARASQNSTMDVAGLGNDNTGTSRYEASRTNVPLTTSWQKFILPIPLPDRLTDEKGLFFFAEGAEGNEGHRIWFDDIIFESVTTITNPRPAMIPGDKAAIVGNVVSVTGTQTTFDVEGTPVNIKHLPGYFTFFSSDESVATIAGGRIEVVGPGTAVVTAKLDTIDVTGSLTLRATAPPTTPPPVPTLPAGDVISLFSGVYPDVPVDRWTTDWDQTDLQDLVIAGDMVKAYTNLVFAGIEFVTEPIDATSMTHFHMDLWVPEGRVFRIKLVDFGLDGEFGGGDDSEHEVSLWSGSDPPLEHGSWIDVDLPLADFSSLTWVGSLAQLIISGDTGTAYIDNVYFHK